MTSLILKLTPSSLRNALDSFRAGYAFCYYGPRALFSIIIDRAGYGLHGRQWTFRLLLGRGGAGYCTWLFGRRLALRHLTIFVARNCYDPRTVNTGRAILPWQIGITASGNRAPYVSR
jgi:hypothetical protein